MSEDSKSKVEIEKNRKFFTSFKKGNFEEEKKRTLNLSIKEGSAAAFMTGSGESYITPYALALNASNSQIGLLTSLSGLFGPISQIFGSKSMYKYSRRKLITTAVFLQATMWLIILGLGILYFNGIITNSAVPLLIFLYSLYAIVGAFGGPAWFSLMGDLVPEEKRGKYFSKRNKITGAVSMIVMLAAAFILDFTKEKNLVIFGFAIVFGIACIGRYVSAYLLSKHYYPRVEIKKKKYFSFIQFIKKAPSNNFGKFVIFVGLITLATNFAGPFFAVYMLKDLGYSYTWFTIINLSSALFTILSMSLWGKIGDRYGNRKLLKIGSIFVPLAPLPWLISGNLIFLIFTAQFISGVGWGAFNFAASNFIYDSVSRHRRGICVAYYNIINGFGVFVGAVLGGLFAQYVHISFMNIFLLIFLISAIARAIIVLILLPKIKEVRNIEHVSDKDVLRNLLIDIHPPFYGILRIVLFTMINFTKKINEKKKGFYFS